ncbi:hypothetical protein [Sorangium sp. So ce128]|uniref:hypothetical protein n=1 Tax=Sorangium sp. So ce128 TaxID=3133281 RepID=UPI003F5D77C0
MRFNRTIASARAKDHATGKSLLVSRRTILGLPLLAAPALLTGCTAETLLSAGFTQDTASQPPNAQQAVGTVATALGNGNVTVAASPAGEASDQWVLVQHPSFNDVTSIQGRFSAFRGDGQYMATARLFIPGADGGVPTLQFEGFNQPLSDLNSFLHLDFSHERNGSRQRRQQLDLRDVSARAGVQRTGDVQHRRERGDGDHHPPGGGIRQPRRRDPELLSQPGAELRRGQSLDGRELHGRLLRR